MSDLKEVDSIVDRLEKEMSDKVGKGKVSKGKVGKAPPKVQATQTKEVKEQSEPLPLREDNLEVKEKKSQKDKSAKKDKKDPKPVYKKNDLSDLITFKRNENGNPIKKSALAKFNLHDLAIVCNGYGYDVYKKNNTVDDILKVYRNPKSQKEEQEEEPVDTDQEGNNDELEDVEHEENQEEQADNDTLDVYVENLEGVTNMPITINVDGLKDPINLNISFKFL